MPLKPFKEVVFGKAGSLPGLLKTPPSKQARIKAGQERNSVGGDAGMMGMFSTPVTDLSVLVYATA
jgi:hypothetical protein